MRQNEVNLSSTDERTQENSCIPANEQEYWFDVALEASVAGDWETYKLAIERATGQHYESEDGKKMNDR